MEREPHGGEKRQRGERRHDHGEGKQQGAGCRSDEAAPAERVRDPHACATYAR